MTSKGRGKKGQFKKGVHVKKLGNKNAAKNTSYMPKTRKAY